MTPTNLAAIAYAVLALAPISVQLALVAGAPLGHLTLGGKFPGRLPPMMRPVALLQAALLMAMAFVVLSAGGVVNSAPAALLLWPVVGLNVLSLIANTATPSLPERRLWAPILLLMLFAAVFVAFGRS